MPNKGLADIPSTLKRSEKKAQRTWKETHDSAVESYGEGERAHRTAFASLKKKFRKDGDHWERKASAGGDLVRGSGGREAPSKAELYDRAKELDIRGRSSMTKGELAEAIHAASK